MTSQLLLLLLPRCESSRPWVAIKKMKKTSLRRGLVVTSLILFIVLLCYVLKNMNSLCVLPHMVPPFFPRLSREDNVNVTVVTAFFDLGTFQKGTDPSYRFSPDLYLRWAQAFSYLQNPLLFFTDSPHMARFFRRHFAGGNLKVVFLSNRSELASFRQLSRISEILSDPGYPKFYPNTVLPEYPCTQNAKVDVVEKALSWDLFRTEYYAWIDIGYFRKLLFRKKPFWIAVPADFDDRKVAVSLIHAADFTLTAAEIFKTNKLWVGGGMMLATREKYAQFIAEYRQALQHFLGLGLVNTDQQVLYAMFKPSFREKFRVVTELQLFSWPLNSLYNRCWFYLGFHCYREE